VSVAWARAYHRVRITQLHLKGELILVRMRTVCSAAWWHVLRWCGGGDCVRRCGCFCRGGVAEVAEKKNRDAHAGDHTQQ
jgi:putative component of membrane protein insertase Oxa1/YidC/SpoIIIJ protein YidD